MALFAGTLRSCNWGCWVGLCAQEVRQDRDASSVSTLTLRLFPDP